MDGVRCPFIVVVGKWLRAAIAQRLCFSFMPVNAYIN